MLHEVACTRYHYYVLIKVFVCVGVLLLKGVGVMPSTTKSVSKPMATPLRGQETAQTTAGEEAKARKRKQVSSPTTTNDTGNEDQSERSKARARPSNSPGTQGISVTENTEEGKTKTNKKWADVANSNNNNSARRNQTTMTEDREKAARHVLKYAAEDVGAIISKLIPGQFSLTRATNLPLTWAQKA